LIEQGKCSNPNDRKYRTGLPRRQGDSQANLAQSRGMESVAKIKHT